MIPDRRPFPTRALALLLAASMVAVVAWGEPQPDPLKSEACAVALQRLGDARRDKALKAELLRREASQACLGAAPPAQQPSRETRPAAAVELTPVPAAHSTPMPSPLLAASTERRPPVMVDRLQAVTQCDAGGCWDPQGRRLDRIGEQLIGSRGPCLPQAGGFTCP